MRGFGFWLVAASAAMVGWAHASTVTYRFDSGTVPLTEYCVDATDCFDDVGDGPLPEGIEEYEKTASFGFRVTIDQDVLPFSLRNATLSFDPEGAVIRKGAQVADFGPEFREDDDGLSFYRLGVERNFIDMSFGAQGQVVDWDFNLLGDPTDRRADSDQTGVSQVYGYGTYPSEYYIERPGTWRKSGTVDPDVEDPVAPIPLPGSALALVAGLGGLALARRGRRTGRPAT